MKNPPTTLLALLGRPVAGNPTGAMIEAACRSVGLDGGRYVSFDVAPDGLAEAVAALRALGVAGFNVTIPHKVAVIEHLDRLTSAADAIAAVNCVKPVDGELVGDNTDGRGFLVGLAALVPVQGSHLLVLGAGGAARAVAVEAALAGAASITVSNRTLARAEQIAALVRTAGAEVDVVTWSQPHTIPAGVDVVVNATSVGMQDPADVVEVDWGAGAGRVAADVVIGSSTRFLDEAANAGWRRLDGLQMLVEQAVLGFRWWTGAEPDRDAMRAALADALP